MPYGEKLRKLPIQYLIFLNLKSVYFKLYLRVFFSVETMTEDIVYQSTGTKCALSFCKNIYTETGKEGQILFFNFPEDPVR